MFQFHFYVYKLICQKSRRSEADRPLQSFPKIFSTIAFSSSGYSSHCQGHYCLYNRNALQLQQEKCFSISGYQIGNISVARQWRLTSSHTFRMVLIWFIFRDGICPTIFVCFHKGSDYQTIHPRLSFFSEESESVTLMNFRTRIVLSWRRCLRFDESYRYSHWMHWLILQYYCGHLMEILNMVSLN